MSDELYRIEDQYGDSFWIVPGVDHAENVYVWTSVGETEHEVEITGEQVLVLRDVLSQHLGGDSKVERDEPLSPNEAKLRVAVDWELRVKFAYQGDLDRKPIERRLEPEAVYENGGVLYVSGESYSAGGAPEGYRQFRLDRISGEVVVR